jgi:tetratricopeptide (TPR) repeat protein
MFVASLIFHFQSGTVIKNFVLTSSFCLLLLPSISLCAQDIDLGSGGAPGTSKNQKPSRDAMGWGASIEVGRNARAAEDQLKHGNPTAAAAAAERAVKAAPQNARLWFLLGYASRLSGQYGRSVEAYQQGLKLESSNLDGLSGLAQTYQRMGRLDEARRLLMQVVNAAPKRENDLLMAGELFLQSGDPQQGIALLSRAETIHPSSHAEVMLAVAYLKVKQPERAHQMLEQARRRDPKNPSVFRAVANYYREQHDYKAAIAALKSVPGQNTEVLADLAYSYELDGNARQAAETYARAANLAPRQIGLQLSAAQAEMRVGEMDRTRSFLARASQLDPDHYRLHALKAQLARTENRNADAIREYLEAIARLPNAAVPEGQLYPVQLRLNLAEIYRVVGDDGAARQQLAAAETLVNQLRIEGPARAEFLRVRASIRLGGNDLEGAEKDLKEAMQLDPNNAAITLQYGNLLWHAKRMDEAHKLYNEVLKADPKNRYALEALGYMAREENDNASAERYFNQFAADYPDDYVPYLALGDLYTATAQFDRANASYEAAFKRAPQNTVAVANAANAAIEAGRFDLAANWVGRATGSMLDDPRVMRERERVLFHQGKYAESARLGYQVLAQLETDRNASVYLAYDLYNLGRYDETLTLTERYSRVLPKEPNFPLLTGHVHKQSQLLQEAVGDYTEALSRDPKMVEVYVNRGYVLNDLQNADAAIQDFHVALDLQPSNGVAHLGLAFSELQLHHGREALDEADKAEKLLGESGAIHLARATAYRDLRLLDKAEQEYVASLRYAPDDLKLHLALADTEFHARRYSAAVQTLNASLTISPDDPEIYAQLANAHAELHHRDETLHYIEAAEKQRPNSSPILLNTGAALLALGDQGAAMQRFSLALEAPDANRVEARLLFARVFVKQHKFDTAQQQVALAFAESRVGEAPPVTADDFIEAANLFLAMNDFDLAHRYFERARQAGAADEVVIIGEANSAIAEGRTGEAQQQLAKLGNPSDFANNFDYTMAQANIYRQQHQQFQAMTAFARANQLGGEDDTAEFAMQQVAEEQGVQVSRTVSVTSDVLVHAVIDDATILGLDRQIFHNAQGGAIPPPRSLLETLWTNGYRADLGKYPALSGFFQVRNARGQISLPSETLILKSDTWDYTMNSNLNPVLKLGPTTFSFNTGLQFTVRRDKESPVQLNQNLFRQFAYVSTNAIGNWLTVHADAFHETGPFTDQNLHSRDIGAHLQFIVGRPWGRTQFITEYAVRDLLFRPLIREFYTTTTSAGLQHEFSDRLRVAILGEYIRSWRVQDLSYWIAQAMVPAAEVEWKPSRRWAVNGNFAFSRGEGIHDYDNVQNSIYISYNKALRRNVSDNLGQVPVEYPIRFSFGFQNANYFNFAGHNQTILRPIVRLTFF